MNESPCPVCAIATGDQDMLAHLKEQHPADDWGSWSKRAAWANGEVVIGIGRRICYGLAIWPYEEAPRAVIRAMIPDRGRTRYTANRVVARRGGGSYSAGDNRATKQFQEHLRQYEHSGYIRRGQAYIRIVNRKALWQIATRDIAGDRAEFLWIERAVQPAREQVRRAQQEGEKRAALRDLQAVYDLMKSDAGVWHGGRTSVRHVPHGWRGRPS